MDKNQQNQQQDQQGGVGRTFNSEPHHEQQDNQKAHSDISNIDQQEGAMNHGETGGGSANLGPQQDGGSRNTEQ